MTPTIHLGVDISSWNPYHDPREVYEALLRMGGGAEPFYSVNDETDHLDDLHNAFRKAGFRANALYHYVTDPAVTPIFAQVMGALSKLAGDPVPFVLDYEEQYGRTWEQIADDVDEAFRACRDARRSWAQYVNGYWLSSLSRVHRPLWLADPYASEPSATCLVWQKSFVADVPGFDGPVDLDQWTGRPGTFERWFGHYYP